MSHTVCKSPNATASPEDIPQEGQCIQNSRSYAKVGALIDGLWRFSHKTRSMSAWVSSLPDSRQISNHLTRCGKLRESILRRLQISWCVFVPEFYRGPPTGDGGGLLKHAGAYSRKATCTRCAYRNDNGKHRLFSCLL
jgi:hypothetical protein